MVYVPSEVPPVSAAADITFTPNANAGILIASNDVQNAISEVALERVRYTDSIANVDLGDYTTSAGRFMSSHVGWGWEDVDNGVFQLINPDVDAAGEAGLKQLNLGIYCQNSSPWNGQGYISCKHVNGTVFPLFEFTCSTTASKIIVEANQLRLANDKYLYGTRTNNAEVPLIGVTAANNVHVGYDYPVASMGDTIFIIADDGTSDFRWRASWSATDLMELTGAGDLTLPLGSLALSTANETISLGPNGIADSYIKWNTAGTPDVLELASAAGDIRLTAIDAGNVDLTFFGSNTGTIQWINGDSYFQFLNKTVFNLRTSFSNDSPDLVESAATFGVTRNYAKVTGHATGNTVTTITGGTSGMPLVIELGDANVTIQNNAEINLTGDFGPGTAGDTLTLINNGSAWNEVSRSVNT